MAEQRVRALVVDDEPAIRRFLKADLGAHGYRIFEAAGGVQAVAMVAGVQPDVIILDLGLPDLDGVAVIRQVRAFSDTPIVVLSVFEDEASKIAALDAGADDYVTKPFGMGELRARIRTALRHHLQAGSEKLAYACGDLAVDLVQRTVSAAGREVKLTPIEYDLLHVLVAHAGQVVTHRRLLNAVWGPEHAGSLNYLRVYMGHLRQKIEADPTRPRYLITEPGVGYRLRDTEPAGLPKVAAPSVASTQSAARL